MWQMARKPSQCLVPHMRQLESQASSSVQWWLFYSLPDGFLDSSFEPPFLPIQDGNILIFKTATCGFQVKSTSNLTPSKDENITSYDVSALFTCIPPENAVTVVRDYLTMDKELGKITRLTVDQVCDILCLCLKTTYFSFNGTCYVQQLWCVIGSQVFPIIVNVYIYGGIWKESLG